MLKNKKLFAGLAAFATALSLILYFLSSPMAFIGQELYLESGQSVKIFVTPLEIKVTSFESNCPSNADCITAPSLEPEYEYHIWGRSVSDDEINFDDDSGITVGDYRVKEIANGDDWVRIQVTHK